MVPVTIKVDGESEQLRMILFLLIAKRSVNYTAYTSSIMKFAVVGVSGSRFGVCAPGSCEFMRGRRGRLLYGSTWSISIFRPLVWGGMRVC